MAEGDRDGIPWECTLDIFCPLHEHNIVWFGEDFFESELGKFGNFADAVGINVITKLITINC